MADIYVHVDANGTYLGNGGQLMLTLLALELEKMGYSVALFDAYNRLERSRFAWLDLPEVPIAPFSEAMQGNRIISSWIHTLLTPIRDYFRESIAVYDWARDHLRFWDQDELLRQGVIFNQARFFIQDFRVPTVISNASNEPYYALDKMDYRGSLDCWIRGDFIPDYLGAFRVGVGTQADLRAGKPVLGSLASIGGAVRCVGSQLEVREKMARCDWFLYWDPPKPLIFEGEGFGLALHEALACGCKCVARRTPNLAHLEGVVLFAETLEEAVNLIGVDAFAEDGAAFINKFYRFDDRRKAVIEEWLA